MCATGVISPLFPCRSPVFAAHVQLQAPADVSNPGPREYDCIGMKRWFGFLASLPALVAVSALLLAGCPRPREPLRIGVDTWPPYGLFYLAQAKGFFRDEGVTVKLLDFGAVSDVRRAYEQGKLDGVATTVVEVLMARDATARDLRVVRLIDISEGGDVILAKESIRSMRDLRGKRIGVEPASLNMYVLARALEKAGMTFKDVTVVPKEPRAMCDELLADRLDAVVTYPPESARVLADPRFHTVFTSLEIPGEIIDVLAFDARALRARPRDIAGVMRALDRALQYLKENPQDSWRIMADRAGVSPEEFGRLLTAGIILVTPEQQAAYIGDGGKLQAIADSIARTLRGVGLMSDRAGVTDCVGKQP